MKPLTAAIDHRPRAQPILGLAHSRIVRGTTKLLSYGALAGVIGVLLIVAAATLPVLLGYHTYVIDGRSMEPTLKRGSVAITSPTNARGLQVGDIIAYRRAPENPPVLHRIVQVTTDENGQLAFLTQGDQNKAPDPQPVVLHGNGDRLVYAVPYAGYILNFTQSILGRILLIAIPVMLLLAMRFWPGRRARRLSRGETQAVPDGAIRPPIETPAPAEVAVRLANVPSMAKALPRQEDERRELAPSHAAAAAVHSRNVMPIERRLAQAERRELAPSHPAAPSVVLSANAGPIERRLAQAERRERASSERSTPTPAWPSLQAQAEQRHLQRTPTRLSLEAQAVRLRLFQHPAVRRET